MGAMRSAVSLDEVRAILTQAWDLADRGKSLIEASIAARRRALGMLPVGTILDYKDNNRMIWTCMLQPDGTWVGDGNGGTVNPGWVEECWVEGSLRIREE